MAVIPNQKFRFLGGEVSPNLYHSADMDQYGRWFSKAENIRFDTLGAFRNRNGFTKIANTKVQNGVPIKLLSFNFSKEESYLIEMGTEYFRFFEDGVPVYKNGDPTQGVYEVQHTMSITDSDIKYAQSGDIMYIVNGKDPIATLTRNDATGYNWTFDYYKFKNDCYPLKEVNSDKTKTLSITGGAAVGKAWQFKFENSDGQIFLAKNVSVTVTGSTTNTYSTPTDVVYDLQGLCAAINATNIGEDHDLTCYYNDSLKRLIFQTNTTTTAVTNIAITATYTKYDEIDTFEWQDLLSQGRKFSTSVSSNAFFYGIEEYANSQKIQDFNLISTGISWINNYSFSTNVNAVDAKLNAKFSRCHLKRLNNMDIIYLENVTTDQHIWFAKSAKFSTSSVPAVSVGPTPVFSNAYTVTSQNHNFFKNKDIGDVFAIEYEMPPQSINWDGGTSAVGTTTSTILTNGTFTVATSGGWGGTFDIEYSTDNSNWHTIKTVSSKNNEVPHNINETIVVESDSDIIYVRAKVTEALTRTRSKNSYDEEYYLPLNLYMAATKFYLNVYYKVAKKDTATPDTKATCVVVKNSYGPEANVTWSNKDLWKEAAFSSEEGWPSVVGFYQNRLLFGKEYYLFASKTNDFYDFYTKTTLKADDPITMALLSYRYNRIKNILTVRKFFIFTEEGEFGIQSQNALTQTDKNLLPLSYHGSNDCLPVLAGNLALFVDQTNNCIRLFQYSYETDMFEANDASVFLEQLLRNRGIVTTDYLKKTKEALFLDNEGTIWIFKIMPEQEVYAWSHIKYAKAGKIVNMRVVANGASEDLYIAVEDSFLGEKRIEKLSTNTFWDSDKTYTSETKTERFYTGFPKGTEIVAEYEDKKSKIIVQDNGLIVLEKRVYSVTCHYIYVSTATLLSPTTNLTEGVYTTYNKGKPFKVYFAYQDSFGFKVGLEEEEKMVIRFNGGDRPDSSELTTGKRNVLIPARYDGSSRVTFIQDRPYNMAINNVMIDMDYGGK